MKYNVIRISLLCSVALTTLVAGCSKNPPNFSNASLSQPALVAETASTATTAPSGGVKSQLDAHLEAIYGKDAVAPAPSGAAHKAAASVARGNAPQNSHSRVALNAPEKSEASSLHAKARHEIAANSDLESGSHHSVSSATSPKIAKLDKKIAALKHKSPHSKKLIALKKERAKLILAEKKKAKKHHKGYSEESVASAKHSSKLPSLSTIAGNQNALDPVPMPKAEQKSEQRFEEREAKIAKADAKREPIARNQLVDPNAFAGVDDGMPVPKEDVNDRPIAIKDAPPAPVADNDILPKNGATVVPPAVNYPDRGEPIRPTNRYNEAKNGKSKSSSDVASNVKYDAPDGGNDLSPLVIPQEKANKGTLKPQVEISQLNPKKELKKPEFADSDLAQGDVLTGKPGKAPKSRSKKSESVAKNSAESSKPVYKSISGKELAKAKVAEKAVPVMAGHWSGDEDGTSSDSVRISNDLQHIVADRVMEFDGNRCRVKTEGHFILADAEMGFIDGDTTGSLHEIRGTLVSTPYTLASSSENADSCGQIIKAINESNTKVLTQGESVVVENEGDPILLIQGRRYTRSPAGSKM